jgi:mannosyltransferase OCH1-like enzyme
MKLLIFLIIIEIILILSLNIKVSYFENNVKLIPSVIYKIFIDQSMNLPTDLNQMQENAFDSWKELNKDYQLIFLSGNDSLEYLKKYYTQDHIDCFTGLVPYAYKCDFIRYCIIYNEGGWYSDWQQKLLIPLDKINDKNYSWISCFDTSGDEGIKYKCMQNGFFGAQPKNPILKECIDNCIKNYKNNILGINPWFPTGPCLLGDAFKKIKINNIKIGITKNHPTFGPCYEFDNKISIINKCCTSIKTPGSNFMNGNNYIKIWENKKIYNYTQQDTCILLTMTVNINTTHPKHIPINNSQDRLKMYLDVINKYLIKTDLDIYIVESSGYSFPEFNDNPRIKVCSFKSNNKFSCKPNCEATPYEAESILYAYNYFNLNTFKNIIKITGRYYIPNLKELIMDVPIDQDLFFQHTYINNFFVNEQSSEIFGCKTDHLENIMKIILENSKKNINFETTLANLKNYKIYRFPKINLDTPVRRGGDNKLMTYL